MLRNCYLYIVFYGNKGQFKGYFDYIMACFNYLKCLILIYHRTKTSSDDFFTEI